MAIVREASAGPCLLQSPPMVQVGPRLTTASAVDTEGSRHLPVFPALLALSFALARLAFSFAFALAEPVLGLEENPGEVIAQVLNGIHLLDLGRRLVLDNHVGLTGRLVKLQQVLEGLLNVCGGLLPEG